MPSAAPRPCRHRGCPNLVTGSGSLCDEHKQQAARADVQRRGSPSQRGYGRRWRKLRQMKLARNPMCEDPDGVHDHPVAADVVDHIVPKSAGGTDAFENLQSLCESCHNRKTRREQGPAVHVPRAMRRARVTTTVVAGPPGGGKTSWVNERRGWGDLVVDVDALFVALSGGLDWYEKPTMLLPFVMEARDAVVRRLGRDSNVRHAWIITASGDRAEVEKLARALGADLVVLDVEPLECVRRIARDERRADRVADWRPIVDRWFEGWERGFKSL